MILVAGPPCSGKTTLINSKESVKGVFGHEWRVFLNANEIRKTPSGSTLSPTTIVHYDNLRPFKRKLPGFSVTTDAFLETMSHQKNIELITVLAPLDVMAKRLSERKERLIMSGVSSTRIDKIDRVIKLYNNPKAFLKIISEWMAFCELLSISAHYFYLNSDATARKVKGMEINREIESFLLNVPQ